MLTIDSTKFTTTEQKAALAALEDALYGVDADQSQSIEAADPYLPLPEEVFRTLGIIS